MDARPHRPDAAALAALARKYRVLAALRRDHAADGAVAARAVLRDLAREFPGALRELDALPLAALDDRAAALEAAAAGAAVAPWMAWVHGYHALMRATLAIKRRVGPRAAWTEVPPELALELARVASREAGLDLDVAYVRAVARPPGGRLGNVVFERLGRHFVLDPRVLRAAVFAPSSAPGGATGSSGGART